MCEEYGISKQEMEKIKAQAERRSAMRHEFLKNTLNPHKHAAEAGYNFDPALQRFMSMKVTQLEFWQPNKRNKIFGMVAIVIPMLAYGYMLQSSRLDLEQKIRNGEIKYRDRLFKFI